MKIIPRALSAGLALAAVPAQAFVTYQDIVSAATNPDDLSRQALVTIFGDVVTNPLTASSNTIIGNLFMVFNAIIATMGIVWFLFIGIRHAVRTGHQGSVFNNGRDVVGILSVVSGFLMIVPTASGWSLAQLVRQGIHIPILIVRHPYHTKSSLYFLLDSLLRDLFQFQSEGNIIEHIQMREQSILLEHSIYRTLMRRCLRDLFSSYLYLAFRSSLKTGNQT